MPVKHLKQPYEAVCSNCGKKPVSAYNKPHSQHRTKRTVKPNLQPSDRGLICSRCRKTLLKKAE